MARLASPRFGAARCHHLLGTTFLCISANQSPPLFFPPFKNIVNATFLSNFTDPSDGIILTRVTHVVQKPNCKGYDSRSGTWGVRDTH